MQINSVVRSNLLIFLLGVSMICVIYSIYLLSMSLIGLLIIVCFSYAEGDHVRLGINPHLWKRSSYSSLWPFTGFLLYFLWIVISLVWSGGHVGPWVQSVVQNLSMPGIALIFIFMPRLTPKDISLLHFMFYVGLAIACLLVLWVYIPSYEEITLLIGRGRAIPVPMDHIRFSILLSYGSLSALSFLWMGKKWGTYVQKCVLIYILRCHSIFHNDSYFSSTKRLTITLCRSLCFHSLHPNFSKVLEGGDYCINRDGCISNYRI